MITLQINGKKVGLEEAVSIRDYLNSKEINPKAVVIELNYEIPDRCKWHEILLKEGDNVEIVKFIGGG